MVADPGIEVRIPVLPKVIADALVAPKLRVPLAVAPVPASKVTFPPVLVPEAPVAFPPSKLSDPPTAVVVPD